MNCNHHPNEAALAVCMACGAGLCHTCAGTLVAGKHVCSETCGSLVTAEQKALAGLVAKNQFGYALLPPVLLSLGSLFILLALSSAFVDKFSRVDLMAFLFGVVFIFFGFHVRRRTKSAA